MPLPLLDPGLPDTPTAVMVAYDPGPLTPDASNWKARLHQRQTEILACSGATLERAWPSLPMLRLALAPGQLARLQNCPHITRIGSAETRMYPQLTESVPMIGAPLWHDVGWTGAGGTVAILDSGADLTLFDNVVATVDTADQDDDPSDCGEHGTNVAGIVQGVAPGAGLAIVKVFSDRDCYNGDISDIAAGVDWVVEHHREYNIVAVNMSIGGSYLYDSSCDYEETAYTAAIDTLAAAGVLVVTASGNYGSLTGVSYPACLDRAMAVGAVYDADVGRIGWSTCVDASTGPDQIVCFSNGGNQVDILAPGALIVAGGFEEGGTSQAAPHVAGAAALLAQANPELRGEALGWALEDAGVSVEDSRMGLVYPRLDLDRLLVEPPALALTGLTSEPKVPAIGDAVGVWVSVKNQGGDAVNVETMLEGADWVVLEQPEGVSIAGHSAQVLPAGLLKPSRCGALPVSVTVSDPRGFSVEGAFSVQVPCADTVGEEDEGCGGEDSFLLFLPTLFSSYFFSRKNSRVSKPRSP